MGDEEVKEFSGWCMFGQKTGAGFIVHFLPVPLAVCFRWMLGRPVIFAPPGREMASVMRYGLLSQPCLE